MLVTDRWSGHIWDFYLQDRKADTIILKILFDVIFNEQETFNGDLEALKDDMLHVGLDELSKSLVLLAIRYSRRIGREAASACPRRF